MIEFFTQTYFVVLPIVTTALMGWIGTSLKRQQEQLKKEQIERSANSRGTMLILRYMLQRYHAEYTHKDYVTREQFINFKELYEAYHALGGNGFATHMWEDVQKLPTRTDVSESISPFTDMLLNQHNKQK